MDAQLKVSRAVTKLAFEVPFFGSCALSLGTVSTKQIPTAATDGKKILFNPEFVDLQTEPQTVGLICHEVMHVILQHCQQFDNKDPKLCNIAMDYIINDSLLYEQGMQLPEDGIWDRDRSFKNMTWQQVYYILKDIQDKENGNTEGNEKGEGGGPANDAGLSQEKQKEIGELLKTADPEHVSGSKLSEAEMEELKQDIERIVIKASKDAENMEKPGSVPASIRDLINEIRESKISWEEFVFTTVQSRFPDDYSYRRPNKKFLDQGLYLPTMESTRVKRFVFAFDTSGSVSQDELITYYSECNFLINHFKPESVYLMSSDCNVAEVVELEEGETIEDGFYFKGGGGTSFTPVFEHLSNNDIEVDQLIYFSDMYVYTDDFPSIHPDFDVIWVSTGKEYNVPFGQLVMVK